MPIFIASGRKAYEENLFKDCWEPLKCYRWYASPNPDFLLFSFGCTRKHLHTHISLTPPRFVVPCSVLQLWWSVQESIFTLQARWILKKAGKPSLCRGVSSATQLYWCGLFFCSYACFVGFSFFLKYHPLENAFGKKWNS